MHSRVKRAAAMMGAAMAIATGGYAVDTLSNGIHQPPQGLTLPMKII